jgi:hypothetical protein
MLTGVGKEPATDVLELHAVRLLNACIPIYIFVC